MLQHQVQPAQIQNQILDSPPVYRSSDSLLLRSFIFPNREVEVLGLCLQTGAKKSDQSILVCAWHCYSRHSAVGQHVYQVSRGEPCHPLILPSGCFPPSHPMSILCAPFYKQNWSVSASLLLILGPGSRLEMDTNRPLCIVGSCWTRNTTSYVFQGKRLSLLPQLGQVWQSVRREHIQGTIHYQFKAPQVLST